MWIGQLRLGVLFKVAFELLGFGKVFLCSVMWEAILWRYVLWQATLDQPKVSWTKYHCYSGWPNVVLSNYTLVYSYTYHSHSEPPDSTWASFQLSTRGVTDVWEDLRSEVSVARVPRPFSRRWLTRQIPHTLQHHVWITNVKCFNHCTECPLAPIMVKWQHALQSLRVDEVVILPSNGGKQRQVLRFCDHLMHLYQSNAVWLQFPI